MRKLIKIILCFVIIYILEFNITYNIKKRDNRIYPILEINKSFHMELYYYEEYDNYKISLIGDNSTKQLKKVLTNNLYIVTKDIPDDTWIYKICFNNVVDYSDKDYEINIYSEYIVVNDIIYKNDNIDLHQNLLDELDSLYNIDLIEYKVKIK